MPKKCRLTSLSSEAALLLHRGRWFKNIVGKESMLNSTKFYLRCSCGVMEMNAPIMMEMKVMQKGQKSNKTSCCDYVTSSWNLPNPKNIWKSIYKQAVDACLKEEKQKNQAARSSDRSTQKTIRYNRHRYPKVVDVLQRDNRTYKQEKLRFVWINEEQNSTFEYYELRYRWNKHLQKAKVRGRGINHGRHTFASQLLSSGQVPPEWIAEQLGHSDTSMIYKHYGKLIAEDIPDYLSKINNYIRQLINFCLWTFDEKCGGLGDLKSINKLLDKFSDRLPKPKPTTERNAGEQSSHKSAHATAWAKQGDVITKVIHIKASVPTHALNIQENTAGDSMGF
ncbi:hypothetical protein FQR65_LT19619 [Abscondita terminalis]|nr:hypothetical protein FQR65_LT19619 [Abscondita terminalis]